MPILSLTDWNNFLTQHSDAHLLQTGEWGELKSAFGWKPVRLIGGEAGVQILFRKLPLGFTVGYVAMTVLSNQSISDWRWDEIDSVCHRHRAVFCKLEPDAWNSDFILPPSS